MARDRADFPQIPQRPAFLDDEDEAIKRAIELSLVSAKEDDQRRKDRISAAGRNTPSPIPSISFYAGEGTSSPCSQNKPAVISRPRPQASTTGGSCRDLSGIPIIAPPKSARVPTVPPRPDTSQFATLPPRPKTIPQQLLEMQVQPHGGDSRQLDSSDKVSFAEMERLGPGLATMPRTHKTSSTPATGSVINRDMFSAHRSQSVPPGNTRSGFLTPENSPVIPRRPSPILTQAESQPIIRPGHAGSEQLLINLSPKMHDPLDFDLDSLDPLNDGYNPQVAMTPTSATTSASSTLPAETLAAKLMLTTPELQRQRSSNSGTLTGSATNHIYSTHIPSGSSTWGTAPAITGAAPIAPPRSEISLLPGTTVIPGNIKSQTSPLPKKKKVPTAILR